MSKTRKTYEEEAAKLARAIDIAIDSYITVPPHQWNDTHIETVNSHLTREKNNILNPEAKYRSLASLKYSIETVFTYFQEAAGPTVEYFWKQLSEANLDYQRVNKLAKILDRGKIRGRIEYDYITDMLVPAQQTLLITEEEAKTLSQFLDDFEKKNKPRSLKKGLPFFILLSALFLSCGRPAPTKITFDGKTFELPMRVDKAKKALGLTYAHYSGFKDGETGTRCSITTQLEGYPGFPGSDNDSEESYYKDYFVGVSFLQRKISYEEQKTILEKKYGRTFIPQKNYDYFETSDGLIVVLKRLNLVSIEEHIVCFYKGISLDELGNYISSVSFAR